MIMVILIIDMGKACMSCGQSMLFLSNVFDIYQWKALILYLNF